MSLFSVCNWWSTQCSDLDEQYDVASLLCARFGLNEQEKDYILVGSQTGDLSIFYPHLDWERNGGVAAGSGGENGFRASDLLLEIHLTAPVYGLYAGRFSGNLRNENTNQLAVLHPNSIAIYNVKTLDGVAEHGTQLQLQALTEYKFERVAYSFCKGHFGQVKGREFFCIVHLDGTLTFYEQDGISYECRFPGQRSLPSPVAYCERTDSFFRFSATWELECFTYQDLSHSSINKSHYQPIWSVSLGEGIVDMCVIQVKEEFASIMILGERNFICLNDTGKVEFILKLDYVPKCLCSFVVGYYWEPSARLITAIVSDSAKLFIYEDANIIWAAQYQDLDPVAIQRANVSGLPGAIVTLGATGQLRVGYLGSEPYLFKVPALNMQELTFDKAYKELLQLEEEIKEAVDIRDMEAINVRAADDVRLSFSINSQTTDESDALLLDVPAEVAIKELPACTGQLKLKSKVELTELQITFNMPEGIRCNQETITYVDVSAGWTETLVLDFFIAELLHMHSTRIDAVVSFISNKGIPRVVQQSAYLPLNMFFKLKQPQKTAGIKLTFSITSQTLTPKLATFFPEFVTWESEMQALGLLLLCPGNDKTEEMVTIVAAKNSNRIRVQSDSLEALPMVLERLLKVTLEHAATQEGAQAKEHKENKSRINTKAQSILANPALPSQHILHVIDVHRETQENIRKQTTELEELWQQFKTLQRKLQEKSDSEPKETLIMQIEENYDHLIAEGDKLMEMRKDERRQRCDLTCAIVVATTIISALAIDEKVVKVIIAVLCTPVEDWTELSWEESMSPGIDMLHHYGPLTRVKNGNNTTKNAPEVNTSSFEHFDYNRFRRHFAALFERVVRLASMEPTEVSTPASSGLDQTVENSNIMPMSGAGSNGGAVAKQRASKRTTLEVVEDDEEEYDEEDLRRVGYKKDFGSSRNKTGESSEWVNETFELPTSEELFSDLGIWW